MVDVAMKPTIASIVTCSLLLLNACGDDARVAPDAGAPAGDAGPDAPPPAPKVGITFHDFAIAVDVSPDGRLAVFEDLRTADTGVMVHDTVTGTIVERATIDTPARSLVTGVATNGRMSAMLGEVVQASVWSDATEWQDLPSPYPTGCDFDVGGAFDISADGSVVVGMAWNGCTPTAVRWTAAGSSPLAVLGSRSGGGVPTNRASVVSDDGTVIAGFAENGDIDRVPALWSADGGRLLDETMEVPGEVLSINANGKTVAGIRGLDGFVWTLGTGFITLPRLDVNLPTDEMFPNAMSADGQLVFGGIGSAFFTLPTAFVWSAADGTRALADVVAAANIVLPADTLLFSVLGASADGKVLVGTAAIGEQTKTFTLRLP
jgi:hypothetical protein